MSEAVRPIFQDRVLHDLNGNNRAQFDTLDSFLPLLNEIKQDGTFMTAGQMNNMLYALNITAFGNVQYDLDMTNRRDRILRIWDTITVDDVLQERTLFNARLRNTSGNLWEYTELLYDTVYSEDLGVTHHTLIQERRVELTRHSRRKFTGRVL